MFCNMFFWYEFPVVSWVLRILTYFACCWGPKQHVYMQGFKTWPTCSNFKAAARIEQRIFGNAVRTSHRPSIPMPPVWLWVGVIFLPPPVAIPASVPWIMSAGVAVVLPTSAPSAWPWAIVIRIRLAAWAKLVMLLPGPRILCCQSAAAVGARHTCFAACALRRCAPWWCPLMQHHSFIAATDEAATNLTIPDNPKPSKWKPSKFRTSN